MDNDQNCSQEILKSFNTFGQEDEQASSDEEGNDLHLLSDEGHTLLSLLPPHFFKYYPVDPTRLLIFRKEVFCEIYSARSINS